MKKYIFLLLSIVVSLKADVIYELEDMVGWTIRGSKTIIASKEPSSQKENQFNGCMGDTTIFFEGGLSAKCISINITISLMPKAIIFSKESEYKGKPIVLWKMLVNDTIYDIYPN